MWGCFFTERAEGPLNRVFPTHVGVFLRHMHDMQTSASLPHACGGVSYIIGTNGTVEGSSPRMWGCFQLLDLAQYAGIVFPTHVGVFLINAPKGKRQ